MKRLSRLVTALLAVSLLAMSSAQARWGGGYYECKRTPLSEFDGTIAAAALANPEIFGTLVDAVLAADPAVLEALSDPDAHLTVFAPVNDAFDAIPSDILSAILADQGLVTNVLLYHVVADRFDPRKVFYIRKKDSLLGQDLFISRGSSNPTVNQSRIGCQGIKTTNGIIWVIDSVLMPQFLQ